jgi:PAS domain-containing protein
MINADKKLTDNGLKQAAQTSLQLLPLIMNNIPQAVFWKDKDLVYLGCNRAFAEDAGFSSPEEIIGKTDFDMPWKEQALRQITNAVRSSTDLTTILRTAVRELGSVMGFRAIIRMVMLDQPGGGDQVPDKNGSSENANGGMSL